MKKIAILEEKMEISPKTLKAEEIRSAICEDMLNGQVKVLGEADSLEEAYKLCRKNKWYSWYSQRTTRGYAVGEWREITVIYLIQLNEEDPEYDETVFDRLNDNEEGFNTMPFLDENGKETEEIIIHEDDED